MLERLGAVQLDTISVLARSHELVPYARLGAVGRAKVEAAYWGNGSADRERRRPEAFEYWAHAASIIPMADWPLFAFRRRAYVRRGWRWHKVPEGVCDQIRTRLKADGPLTTKELGGAKASAEWWDWSDHKIGIEWLLDIGEVVCVQRAGWRRVYDLAERAVPPELLAEEPDDDACLTALVTRAGRALGVATRGDLADYYRIKQDQVDAVIGRPGSSRSRSPDGRSGPGPTRARWTHRPGAGTPPRCCRRSTRWSGTAPEPRACSASTTAWRLTYRRASASTATSRCRCSPGAPDRTGRPRKGGAHAHRPPGDHGAVGDAHGRTRGAVGGGPRHGPLARRLVGRVRRRARGADHAGGPLVDAALRAAAPA